MGIGFRWVVAAGMVLAVSAGCKGGEGGGGDAVYRVEAAPVQLGAGAQGNAVVKFVPAQGYHWNVEFPARLQVSEAGPAQAGKKDFAMGDFQDQGGTGVLSIPVTAQGAGAGKLAAKADFSMCTAKECRIFKGIPIEVPIHVQ